jgi:peroxiredoxin
MSVTPPATPPRGRTSLAGETPTLRVGMPAPDFDLPAHDATRARLSALRGKSVVLAFMANAFTGT